MIKELKNYVDSVANNSIKGNSKEDEEFNDVSETNK